jgi:hypothetical protein
MTVYFAFWDGTQYYFPTDNSYDLKVMTGGKVVNDDPSTGAGISDPNKKDATSAADVEVSYSVNPTTGTREITNTVTYTEDSRTCKECGAPVYATSEWYGPWGCGHNGDKTCPANIRNGGNKDYLRGGINAEDIDEKKAGDTVTTKETYVTGTGVITIQNIGKNKVNTAKIVVYVDGKGQFIKYSGSDYVTYNDSTAGSATTCSYKTSGGTSASVSKYIELNIKNLAANTDSRKSDKLKINYAWAIPKKDYDNGIRPCIAVFSESYT